MPVYAYRGRFAPSPTGPLHVGSLLTALASWLLARQAGGQWIVRIEDVDRLREVPGAAEHQLTTLRAFGLESDLPVVRQSEREPLYRRALKRLSERGLAFPCHCSRSALAGQGNLHHACITGSGQQPRPAVRLRVPAGSTIAYDDLLQGPQCQDVHAQVGDFVLARADGCWAYQLAVVVDDAEQGITDVVRGADLLASTPRQILLQQDLGLPTPRYLHLPLVVDAAGRKLSKSQAAMPVSAADPLPALRWAWQALGQPPLPPAGSAPALLEAMRRHFDPTRLPRRNIEIASLTGRDD